ncbi:exodeoxyribonuclease VII large subunit [Allobaculum sp. Allo2]|uniref:exodeoxyribonuclease VII large subunit n=1 Tax=Allobaculum sp. Allo2 TaxID=2853432 RepID=UPI001F61B5F8|nr:exodeoxyribonuclease VII large subunit [Allobaculum sp. Allo2]UNT92494.1 exodeoxyribonuclease VII large subunit [Allobaculum sp. Allo2]
MKTIKVSQLVTLVSQFLTSKVHTDSVMISGELSNVRYVSGHCYFDLKDEEGQLSCTLWRSNASRVGFTLEDGMAVLVHGTLDLYVKRGQLKFNVDHVELGGIGALYLQLEERKKRLAAEGLFDQGRKSQDPRKSIKSRS